MERDSQIEQAIDCWTQSIYMCGATDQQQEQQQTLCTSIFPLFFQCRKKKSLKLVEYLIHFLLVVGIDTQQLKASGVAHMLLVATHTHHTTHTHSSLKLVECLIHFLLVVGIDTQQLKASGVAHMLLVATHTHHAHTRMHAHTHTHTQQFEVSGVPHTLLAGCRHRHTAA